MHIDAVDLEVVKASLSGIVQEMQNSLFRTGFSTIVRESQDASCALMNADGDVVAQHVVLPLHIGAFPACCGAVLKEFGGTFAEGGAFLINDPYAGGSPHAPDFAVMTPVIYSGRLIGFSGSIAHKSDTGGPRPGSCPGHAAEAFHEALHSDFAKSADQTRGPANIRPPLVQAAIAYCLISKIDPRIYVSSGLLRAFTLATPEGSVVNPRYPAPVNTYNPTIHAVVDAIFEALSHVIPGRVRADGSGSRSIIIGGGRPHSGQGCVQNQIVGGRAGPRPGRHGAPRPT